MLPGRVVDDKLELLRVLGEGGMGTVFEAHHVRTGRHVAVKVVRGASLEEDKRAEALRRFTREARAVGRIESDHVVSVLDTGIAAGADPYLVMELLRGEDLGALLRRAGSLQAELAVRIVYQACCGVHAAHEQGVVHRDIKAANLFLARREPNRVVTKVLDFGIAKLRPDPLSAREEHDLTRSGSVLGSPVYMAPEQAMGARHVDRRADIWSLGIVLYEALCGSTPHERGALGSLILAICSQPPQSVRERAPWVSSDLAAIVHKALMLDPDQRFQSAEAMARALAVLAGGDTRITADALPALAERRVDSVDAGSLREGTAADGDTTAEPFTLRQLRSERSGRDAGGGRASPRAVLLAAGAVGLVVAILPVIEHFRRPPRSGATIATTPPPAPPSSPRVRAGAPGSGLPPTTPSQPLGPTPAATHSAPRSPDGQPPRTRRQKRPPPAGNTPVTLLEPPASSLTAPAPSAPPTMSPPVDPTIDRHFD